jgi:uncharacterized protein YfdQ (DUF2303 family)
MPIPETQKNLSDIAAAIEAGRATAAVTDLSNGHFVLHKDMRVERVEEVIPITHRSNAVLSSISSFISYVNKYKDDRAYGFIQQYYDNCGYEASAFLSYMTQEDGEPADNRKPISRASYRSLKSSSLTAWQEKNGKSLGQNEFSEFIEFRRKEIVAPTASELLEMVRTFESTRNVIFKSAIDDRTGRVSVTYQDDEKHVNGETGFPARISIDIPLFQGASPVQIDCKVRYRCDEGKLRITYQMENLEPIYDSVLATEFEAIRSTGIPFYDGYPADVTVDGMFSPVIVRKPR